MQSIACVPVRSSCWSRLVQGCRRRQSRVDPSVVSPASPGSGPAGVPLYLHTGPAQNAYPTLLCILDLAVFAVPCSSFTQLRPSFSNERGRLTRWSSLLQLAICVLAPVGCRTFHWRASFRYEGDRRTCCNSNRSSAPPSPSTSTQPSLNDFTSPFRTSLDRSINCCLLRQTDSNLYLSQPALLRSPCCHKSLAVMLRCLTFIHSLCRLVRRGVLRHYISPAVVMYAAASTLPCSSVVSPEPGDSTSAISSCGIKTIPRQCPPIVTLV